jgi:ribosomal protein S12 methylthiotransferase
MSDNLIDIVRDQPKICAYFDLPLQHVNTRILKLMRRASTGESTRALLEKIRQKIPQATIRANFIVGFPSETEAEFEELKAFLQNYQLDRVGIFPYSPEPGTPAAELPGQIEAAVKNERYEILRKIQAQVSAAKLKNRLGNILDVMVTHSSGYGRSQHEAPEVDGVIKLKSKRKLKAGMWVRARVTHSGRHDLQAVCLS